jgi:hypothetical protein
LDCCIATNQNYPNPINLIWNPREIIISFTIFCIWGHRGCDRMVVGFTTTVPITTKVVSSNPDHGEVYIYIYLIQHYVIKIVSATGQWFSPGTPVSSTNKTDSHDITEILLKVALNTINQTFLPMSKL